MKKIGYHAFLGTNYGSVLQAFALFTKVKQLGFDCELLGSGWYLERPIPSEADKLVKPKEYDRDIMRVNFEIFIKENFKINSDFYRYTYQSIIESEYLQDKIKDFDAFLCGSDQVWNPNEFWFKPENYLLFADKTKRVSYAPSIGYLKIPDSLEKFIPTWKIWLNEISHLSVRESSSACLIEQLIGKKPNIVIDPTLLLTPKQWLECINKPKFSSEIQKILDKGNRYMIAYLLDNYDIYKNWVENQANKLDLEIIWLTGRDWTGPVTRNCSETDPFGFVYLFSKASFACVDGFHGSCFAINFSVPFVLLTKQESMANDSRMIDLYRRLGIKARVITDPNTEILTDEINFDLVQSKLSDERYLSVNYLFSSLTHASSCKNIFAKFDVSNLCTGCGACSEICPQKCIRMINDVNGFLRPEINLEKCNNCGLCVKHCIKLNPVYKNKEIPICYAFRASDDIRKVSSSGGVFTVAAEEVISRGGYVCGAVFTDNFEVEHILTNSIEDLQRIRGSKYMQSRVCHLYPAIEKLLMNNTTVLFTGLPCQVAGIQSYLRKSYSSLITIDLVCHGITSCKIFSKYYKDIHKSRTIKSISFKAKEPWGWHAGVNITYEDGNKYSEPLERDPFYKAYLSSLSKNRGCQDCTSNHIPRQGDLTIGDFWGCERYDKKLNDGKGTSIVLINSDKGEQFFQSIMPQSDCTKVPLEFGLQGNPSLIKSYHMHANRDLFINNYKYYDFSELTNDCISDYKFRYIDIDESTIPDNEKEFYYLAKIVSKNYNGRKIVSFVSPGDFGSVLKKYFNLDISFGVSLIKDKLIDGKILDFYSLNQKSSEFYIVSLDRAYDEWIYGLLQSFGFTEWNDFVFRTFKPIIFTDISKSKYQALHQYGLITKVSNDIQPLKKLIINGFNNSIIAENVYGLNHLTIIFGSNQNIKIGRNTSFEGDILFDIYNYILETNISIGEDCKFGGSALFKVFPASNIYIGNNCTFGNGVEFHANSGNNIVIGKDCMISYDVEFWSGDGHSLFDVETGKCLNSKSKDTDLVIEDHVWVGKGATILNGSKIGNGSVVGAKSVVKAKIPNNCVVVGNPGRVKKLNVAWSRSPSGNFWECDFRNYGFTDSSLNYESRITNSNQSNNIQSWFITGGSTGLGKSLALKLLKMGHKVAVSSRNINRLNGLPSSILRVELDVSDYNSCKDAVDYVEGQFGRIDVLINNAGLFCTATCEEMPDDDAMKVFDTNFKGVLNMSRAIIPYMRKAKQGIIANISSLHSFIPALYSSYYSASKFAIRNFSHSISFECRKFLKCIDIQLGAVDTGIWDRRLGVYTKYDIYERLSPLYSCDYKFSNDLEKVTNTIIASVNSKHITTDLLLGYDSLQLFKSWIHNFESNTEKYKEMSFMSDVSRTSKVELPNIIAPRNTKLKVQNWLITGASDGLGKVLALKLVDLGYNVAVTSRDINRLNFYSSNVVKIQSNLDSLNECERVVQSAIEAMGTIDVLVNNAAADCWSSFEECPYDVMNEILKTTFYAPQRLIKSILPHYRNNLSGTVVNISSIAAIQPYAYVSVYSAGKAALVGLTQSLSQECSRFARFMTVYPVYLGTDIMKKNPIIKTAFCEYSNLGKYSPNVPDLPTRKEIVVQQIINLVNSSDMPLDILLGENSYLIAKNEINRNIENCSSLESVAMSVVR